MLNNLLNDKKKRMYIIGGIVLFFIFLGVVFIVFNKSDGENFKYEYEKLNDKKNDLDKKYPNVDISSDNVIRYVSYNEIFDVFDNMGDEVIYIGYPKCLYCRTVAQVLTDTAKDTDIDEIYYLDVEEKKDGYAKLLKIIGNKFFNEGKVKDKIYVPSVLFVVNGKIVSYNKGTLFSHEDPYEKLDQSQIDGLSRIYRNGINDVIKSKNTKLDK